MTARSAVRLLGTLALALACAGCRAKEPEPVSSPAAEAPATEVKLAPEALRQGGVRVEPAAEAALAEPVVVPGNVQPQGDALVLVNTHSDGEVVALRAQVGDRVRAGQVLAVLASIDLAQIQADHQAAGLALRQGLAQLAKQRALTRITREQAQARVEASRRLRVRSEKLYADGIVSRQDLEAAQAATRQAELDVGEQDVLRRDAETGSLAAEVARPRQVVAATARRIRLVGGAIGDVAGRVPITATIAGQVVSRKVSLGQALEPHTALFEIVDAGKLVALLDVPEGQARAIAPGTGLTLTADALPGHTFAARVAAVGDVVDPGTRKVPVRCTLSNPAGELRPGMFVTAKLAGAATRRTAVPEGAVQTMDGKPVVFVALGGGRFARREVETGVRDGGRVAIVSGLKPGERVAVAGAFWLKSELQKAELEE